MHFFHKFREFLARFRRPPRAMITKPRPKILLVVEGRNDIEFLRRISAIMHRQDSAVPDLAEMERAGRLLFVPTGGGDSSASLRFVGLGLPEFHLLDRDVPPTTAARQRAAAIVNARSFCCAVITR